jgi:hypothetical protein
LVQWAAQIPAAQIPAVRMAAAFLVHQGMVLQEFL